MTKKFRVKLPDKPNGKSICVCFASLESQMIKANMINASVSRLRIDTKDKAIVLELEEKE